jgi:hypothetical protein
VHDAIMEVYGAMLNRVRARMDAGEDVEDCLAKTLLLEQENEGMDWEDMCMLSAVFTLGGVHSVRLRARLTAVVRSKVLTHRVRRLGSSSGSSRSSRRIQRSRNAHTTSLTR